MMVTADPEAAERARLPPELAVRERRNVIYSETAFQGFAGQHHQK